MITPVESVFASANRKKIYEWSKSNVRPASNGTIFP